MAKADIVAGIDLGSGQITCVIGERDFSTDTVNVKGASRQPCRGLKGGVVINIDETALAVTRAVEEAEKMADLVAIIDHGQIIAQGTPTELNQQSGTTSLEEAFLKLTGSNIRAESVGGLDQLRGQARAWGRR